MTGQGSRLVDVCGLDFEIARRGAGAPLVFLHPHIGLERSDPFLDRLAACFEVVAPSHPGFGRSAVPSHVTTVDDVAYAYLDLLEHLDLREVTLVGASFGAWIAMAVATKTVERISRLVLLNPLAAKFSDRESKDVADIYAIPQARFDELAYHDPSFAVRDYGAMTDEALLAAARDIEATARYAWNPYMYDPKLRSRLHRVRVPTLVLWGLGDRFADIRYGREYARAIPGAAFEEVANAGHFPHIEQPAATADRVIAFSGGGR